jgi:hypothetical protein
MTDTLILPADEAKVLAEKGWISVSPIADRFRVEPKEITGWRPRDKLSENPSNFRSFACVG